MDSQTKRTLLATVLCLAILFGWFELMKVMYPGMGEKPPVPVASAPAPPAGADVPPEAEARISAAPAAPDPGSAAAAATTAASEAYKIVGGASRDVVTLGDDRQDLPRKKFDNPYELAVDVTPIGAGVEAVRLSQDRNEVAKDKKNPDHDPYVLLEPITDPATNKTYTSFTTLHVVLVDEKRKFDLSDAVWTLTKSTDDSGETAELTATIQADAKDLLALKRTYRLDHGAHHLKTQFEVENLDDRPHRLAVVQRGPIGVKNDDPKTDYRKIVAAVADPAGRIVMGPMLTRAQVFAADAATETLAPGEDRHILWVALASKYFACLAYPVPQEKDAAYSQQIEQITARAYFDDKTATNDLAFEESLRLGELAPKKRAATTMEIFCGPKSTHVFDRLPVAIARHYEITQQADRSSWCTFQWLSAVMLWLLTAFYKVTRNYGVAIILLVVVVRAILHPITKRGQLNMMKTQKSMAQLKPKLEALQQQFKNDRQKLNDETMKLYRSEGVNPAGGILGCLPMLLQMPVWVALWTTLNTNADMRHEPFVGWMRDLSSPDALIAFAGVYNIPLLGAMMGPIHALNVLPIIMTITMYAQQKLTQKLTKPTTPQPQKVDADGKPIPDPMAQQQKIMSFMMLFFGLLFYNFPSGLNLYILSSNLLGMLEQYIIKKEIREKEERGEFSAPRKDAPADGNGRPSLWKRLSDRVEDAKRIQSDRSREPSKKRRKQPRS